MQVRFLSITPMNIDLLTKVYEQLQESVTPNTSILMYNLLDKINPEGLAAAGFKYNVRVDPIAMAKQIKTAGLKPDPKRGLSTEIGGKRIPVILCQHNYFTSGDEENGTLETYVVFRKKLSEIFIDHDEYDPDELGIIPGSKGTQAVNYIQKQMDAGKPISMGEITGVLKIGKDHQLYGTYVYDIKPQEVVDVRICPLGYPNKSKSLLGPDAKSIWTRSLKLPLRTDFMVPPSDI